METFGILQIVGLAILAILVIIFFYYVPFMLWINAVVSGVHVSLVQLFLMRIRKVPPTRIVNCLIEAHKAGLTDVKRDGLEAHFLAGGHIERVVHALVSASMNILNDKGYCIARRTVAKYREMMDIPVARLRKQI